MLTTGGTMMASETLVEKTTCLHLLPVCAILDPPFFRFLTSPVLTTGGNKVTGVTSEDEDHVPTSTSG